MRRLALTAVVAVMTTILLAPAPWLHDFGEWLFQARVLALKILDPDLVSGYQVAPYPVPNSLAILLLALLSAMMPALIAGKAFLLLQLLAWVWLLRAYVNRFVPDGSRGSVFLVLIGTVALSSFYWYGFISYQLGLWLLFLFLLRCNRDSPAWRLALFGVALFLCHAMAVLIWGLILLAWAVQSVLQERPPLARAAVRLFRHSLPLIPAVALVVWYLVGRLLAAPPEVPVGAQMSGLLEAAEFKAGYPLMLGSFRNILLANGKGVFEDWPAIYLIGAGCNLALAAILGLWGARLLWGCRTGLVGAEPTERQALCWVAWALVPLYLIAPYSVLGLLNPAGRLLLPWLGIGLLLTSARDIRWWRWAAWPAALGLTISVASFGGMVWKTAADPNHPHVSFLPGAAPPKGTHVFRFNQALYPETRFPFFNYRLLVNERRFAQLKRGTYRGLGFRTGPVIDYRPDPVPPR